jgi:hypothetical protein
MDGLRKWRRKTLSCGSRRLEATSPFDNHIVADIPEPQLEWPNRKHGPAGVTRQVAEGEAVAGDESSNDLDWLLGATCVMGAAALAASRRKAERGVVPTAAASMPKSEARHSESRCTKRGRRTRMRTTESVGRSRYRIAPKKKLKT